MAVTALVLDLTNKKNLPKSQISGNNIKELRKSQSKINKLKNNISSYEKYCH